MRILIVDDSPIAIALLEKALRAVANVQLAVANDLTDAGAGFDFIVLDGVVPTAWPKGNVLGVANAVPFYSRQNGDL